MSCRLINNMKLHNLAHHITVLQPMICLHLQHFPQYFRKYKTWLFWHNIKVKVHGNYNCFALLPPLKNLKLAATLLQPLPTITTAHVMEGGWNQDYKISWWKGKKMIGWSRKTQKMEFYFFCQISLLCFEAGIV